MDPKQNGHKSKLPGEDWRDAWNFIDESMQVVLNHPIKDDDDYKYLGEAFDEDE